ncbi:MAG: hypothetical protein K5770_12490 [Lachnospiraceae bacterium]|nr:hypothetical protein [Lachnospiraceae bacterium]
MYEEYVDAFDRLCEFWDAVNEYFEMQPGYGGSETYLIKRSFLYDNDNPARWARALNNLGYGRDDEAGIAGESGIDWFLEGLFIRTFEDYINGNPLQDGLRYGWSVLNNIAAAFIGARRPMNAPSAGHVST